jgi:hypothetical protein
MATLKDAEQARTQASEQLLGLGAHAISVEEEPPDDAAADPDAATGTRGTAVTAEEVEAGEGVETSDDAVDGGPRRRRRRAFAVVAWFAEEPPADLPQALEVGGGTRKKVVPLRVRRAERFRAE